MRGEKVAVFLANPIVPAVMIMTAALASFLFMKDVALSGDESFYRGSATLLANSLLSGHGSALVEAFDKIRGRGFFMPGMPVFLTPVALAFGGSAPAWAFRLWMVIANAGLLFWICHALRERYSKVAPPLFLVLPILSPYYVMYLSALWGDLIGIHLAVLFIIWIDGYLRSDEQLPAAQSGAFVAGLTYVRHIFPPLLLATIAGMVLRATRRGTPDIKACAAGCMAALKTVLVFVVLLSPWSIYISAKYGPTITVVTFPISRTILFGDNEYLKRVLSESHVKNIYPALHDRVADEAIAAGRSFEEQAKIEYRRATEGADLLTARKRLSANIRSYFWAPNQFLSRFWSLYCKNGGCIPELRRLMFAQNLVAYGAMMLVGIALFVYPFGIGMSGYIPAFLFKALVFLICTHPYMVTAHGRYYVQLFPLVALAISVVITARMQRYTFDRNRTIHDALVGLGQLLAVCFVAVTLALSLA
jgi:hypothetical protein